MTLSLLARIRGAQGGERPPVDGAWPQLLDGLAVEGRKLANFHFKPLLLVLSSIVLFGSALEKLGLMVSIFILVVLASLGGRQFRSREVFFLAGILAAGSFLVFSYGLGLQIPIWPFSY